MTNFKLALVEPYLPVKHGILNKENDSMYGKYLIIDQIDMKEFYNKMPDVLLDVEMIRKMYKTQLQKLKTDQNITQLHPFIKNYEKIVTNPNNFQLQLIEPVTISTGPNEWDNYYTAVIKTHWIRLIQRRWRETLKKRIQARKNVKNLQIRETTGSWTEECNSTFKLGL
mgnify:CR=1 FL=1|jgi:hypothetical protein